MIFPEMLEGSRVRLSPMNRSHTNALYAAAKEAAIWTYLPLKIDKIADMNRLIDEALEERERGLACPFVVYDRQLNKLVGSTRYLNISTANRNLEIGWTWYSPDVWRSRVNTECKYLLLRYAFEELQCIRVQFKADVQNDRSNRAIERLGAVHEGVLRADRILPDGYIRSAN
ncbi:GNAT family N-acetyltransferase, partial [Paenibacillus sp. J5C_2022]|uniref:GNAT family N-acetyltransferase n=1 Tax=Paenibacillus sp. J5C2022 TaxID=2977129 RepID=UPI0021D33E2B